MYEITVEVKFDMAHRLLHYSGKCHHIHGHSYVATVGVESEELVEAGFVLDFANLKKVVKEIVDRHWDHSILLHSDDPLLMVLANSGHSYAQRFEGKNPTAENMAWWLFYAVQARLEADYKVGYARVAYVTIQETETSHATYRSSEEVLVCKKKLNAPG